MDYIRFAISNPVKVTVGVLLLLLFGLLSLFAIPIQLVPNVDQPVITIETTWTGTDPTEVEREIVEEQEDKLDRVGNVRKMIGVASPGRAEITLEFYIGTDMTRAVQEVSDKLREVPEYPEGVDEPVITVADAASQNAIAWMVITSDDPDFDVETIRDQVEDRIKPFLERVGGISQVNVYGGRDREVHIRINPRLMAQRGITFSQLRGALRLENINVSAGEIADGRVDVRVRTVGQYDDLDEIARTVVAHTDGGPVYVRDLGEVVLAYEKRRAFVRSKGQPAVAMNAIRKTGSNVIAVMEELHWRLERVNEDILPTLGPKLTVRQVYDETDYIYAAIDLVVNNLWIGGSLAAIILMLFLRILRPTLIVALSIPVSVIGTFVVMTVSGRNINVVSLAGLAFAVGMVVDNAIVVLENIDRHLAMNKSPREAAYDGAREVWGAILASTLTTLAVFIPVLFMAEEAGQLFRDIALAICAAVTLSLIVAVTVIPTASARWLTRRVAPRFSIVRQFRGMFGITKLLDNLTRIYAGFIYWMAAPDFTRVLLRLLVVGGITVAAVGASYLLMPPTSYLPNGNRNLIFGIMLTPPAYSLDQAHSIARRVESGLRPYWQAGSMQDTAALPPVIHPFTQQPIENIPPIENFFFVRFNSTIFMGAASVDPENVVPLEGLLNASMSKIPGAFAFAFQPSIFGRGVGASNAVEVEVVGNDLAEVRNAAGSLFGSLAGTFGKVRPEPANFNLAGPEIQVRIDRVRAADLGVDVAQLGLAVQALVDGAVVGEYRLGGESIDIQLIRHPDFSLSPQTLSMVPVAVREPDGSMGTVPLSSIATMVDADAPQQIRRIEKLRAVTITVEPPREVPLETASAQIRGMVQGLRQEGAIDEGVSINLAGTADKLTQVRRALIGQWEGWTRASLKNLISSRMFLALLVTYLLMAALFESFIFPFVIMFSVPLATVGGFLGLRVVHEFVPEQQLDVLAMLGFVILIGVVVNNAILIVHQALNFMRGIGEAESASHKPVSGREAIRESVRTRIRPVFMTTMTSVFGMLPLVIMPGSGSELYRGLGGVVVGGLFVSALFTLLVVPLLFSLVLDARAVLGKWSGQPSAEPAVATV